MKKTLLYISAIIILLQIAFTGISFANYTDEIADAQQSYNEEINKIFDEYENNLSNLKESFETETKDLEKQQKKETETAYENYEKQYPGITFETFKTTSEYQDIVNKQNLENENLEKKHEEQLNQLEKEKTEALDEIRVENEEEISSAEFNKAEEEYDQWKKDEIDEIKKEIENYNKILTELQNKLKATTDTKQQQEIIKKIDQVKESIEDLKKQLEEVENMGDYEEQLAKNKEKLSSFLSEMSDKIDETLAAAARSKEFSPSPIPKPSTLPGPTLTTPNQERKIVTTKILPRIASFIIGFAGVLALVSILFSGVRMMLSGGEEEVFNSSKARIQWAILGLLVSILAFIAVQITININFEENKSPTQNEENN